MSEYSEEDYEKYIEETEKLTKRLIVLLDDKKTSESTSALFGCLFYRLELALKGQEQEIAEYIIKMFRDKYDDLEENLKERLNIA